MVNNIFSKFATVSLEIVTAKAFVRCHCLLSPSNLGVQLHCAAAQRSGMSQPGCAAIYKITKTKCGLTCPSATRSTCHVQSGYVCIHDTRDTQARVLTFGVTQDTTRPGSSQEVGALAFHPCSPAPRLFASQGQATHLFDLRHPGPQTVECPEARCVASADEVRVGVCDHILSL